MFWGILNSLDALISLILIIIYGLLTLRNVNVAMPEIYFFSRLLPIIFVSFNILPYFLLIKLGPLVCMESNHPYEMLTDPTKTSLNTGILTVDITPPKGLNLPFLDIFYALLIVIVMSSQSYQYNTYGLVSFESILMLIFTFIGGIFMIHSTDLLTFYIALEAQNFSFMILCGLHSQSAPFLSIGQAQKRVNVFGVEATIKYFLLSAFSSGVLLFMFSLMYLQTGQSSIRLLTNCLNGNFENNMPQGSSIVHWASPKEDFIPNIYDLNTYLFLSAMMFKLGAAPLHLWVVQIYGGVKRSLLLYIATAPKYSLFGFWITNFQTFWTDFTVVLFALFSLILGSIGAYNQPTLRALFAYSTINEIGLLLLAVETAGFHSLFQHLGIYIISQALLWNIYNKKIFSFVGVSLAGLPPLAGFFGKAWIFWHTVTVGLYSPLIIGLICTALSLVYYLRILRLFPIMEKGSNNSINKLEQASMIITVQGVVNVNNNNEAHFNINKNPDVKPLDHSLKFINYKQYNTTLMINMNNSLLTTTLLIFLVFSLFFFIKPFVL